MDVTNSALPVQAVRMEDDPFRKDTSSSGEIGLSGLIRFSAAVQSIFELEMEVASSLAVNCASRLARTLAYCCRVASAQLPPSACKG